MFEAFTPAARDVVVLAQEESRDLNHDHIGTEHLLLGLLQQSDSVAAEALGGLGVSPEAARREVVELVGRGAHAPSGHIPFTPRAKKILELSLREARSHGSDHIGAEHILLGLLREGGGVAMQVLVKLGADADRVRQRVAELTTEADAQPVETAPGIALGSRRARRLMRDFTAVLEENDVLREEVMRLQRLLKSHGIDPRSA